MTERKLPATLLDLRTVTAPEVVVDRVYPAGDVNPPEGDEYRVKGDARFTGRLQKLDEHRFRLEGTVRAIVEVACGRCLEPFELPVVADVDLTYVPQPTGAPASAKAHAPDEELGDEDLSTAYYEDQRLDLGEMLREQFTLALPMRPLCQEACKGLCPQCGVNRNRETCACDVKWEDPRLAGLRSLLDREHNA